LQILLIMDSLLVWVSIDRQFSFHTYASLEKNQEDQLHILTYSNKIASKNKNPRCRFTNISSLSLSARDRPQESVAIIMAIFLACFLSFSAAEVNMSAKCPRYTLRSTQEKDTPITAQTWRAPSYLSDPFPHEWLLS
jgi:hypothetical protein